MRRLLLIGSDSALTHFIERFTRERVMEKTAKLMKEGSHLKTLPSPPTDTPTNRATLMMGCWADSHGLTSFNGHLPGKSLTKLHNKATQHTKQ